MRFRHKNYLVRIRKIYFGLKYLVLSPQTRQGNSKLDLGLGSELCHGKSKNVRLRQLKREKARRPVSAFHPLVAEQSTTTTNTKKNDPDF